LNPPWAATASANLALEMRLIYGKPQTMRDRFYSIYSHGFIRAAVCLPSLRVADADFNLERSQMSLAPSQGASDSILWSNSD